MATKLWLGGTSTDVSVAANWSGAAVPALNDTCRWINVTTYAPISGTFTNAIDYFEATEGAGSGTGGNISYDAGTSGSPIPLSAIAGSVRFANRGNVFVTSSGTVAAASFEMPVGSVATLSGGTWTAPVGVGVTVNVGTSAVLTNPVNIRGIWNVLTSGTAITMLKGDGAWNIDSRNITNGRVDAGGRLITTGTTATSAMEISGGARYYHRSSGNVTAEIRGTGSLFTPEGNPNTTGTAPTATITRYNGAKAYLSVPGITLAGTITNVGPESMAAGPVS